MGPPSGSQLAPSSDWSGYTLCFMCNHRAREVQRLCSTEMRRKFWALGVYACQQDLIAAEATQSAPMSALDCPSMVRRLLLLRVKVVCVCVLRTNARSYNEGVWQQRAMGKSLVLSIAHLVFSSTTSASSFLVGEETDYLDGRLLETGPTGGMLCVSGLKG